MCVSQFPHDEHDLTLKLGIISQREAGQRWDRRKWKIGLASENDSRGTIRVPYGVIVDHVEIPGFFYNKKRGLEFQLSPLTFGFNDALTKDQDFFLEVKIPVVRESSYYDYNIFPLLFTLTTVAISFLSLDATHYFQRTLMMLNVSFLEIGLRTTLDKSLPSVGYQIKIQGVFNRMLYSLLFLAFESSIVYYVVTHNDVSLAFTRKIDLLVGLIAFLNIILSSVSYYMGLFTFRRRKVL